MAHPSVTIVIPAFKPRFLAEAIESVLGQEYEPLELIVVDDSGGEEIAPIAEPYSERIRFIRQDNQGQALALNRGFSEARGELVGHIGDDDVLLPGAIGRTAEALAPLPEAVVAYGAYDVIDERGEVTDTVDYGEWSLRDAARHHFSPVGPGGLFRREVIDRVGEWNPEFRYRSDFDFWLRVGFLGPFIRIPATLGRWRGHSEGLTAERGEAIAAEHVLVIERLYERDDLPADVSEVREQALRTAYIEAALICASSTRDTRFLIADVLQPRISARAAREGSDGAGDDALAATLRRRLAKRERVRDALRERLERLERRLARR